MSGRLPGPRPGRLLVRLDAIGSVRLWGWWCDGCGRRFLANDLPMAHDQATRHGDRCAQLSLARAVLNHRGGPSPRGYGWLDEHLRRIDEVLATPAVGAR